MPPVEVVVPIIALIVLGVVAFASAGSGAVREEDALSLAARELGAQWSGGAFDQFFEAMVGRARIRFRKAKSRTSTWVDMEASIERTSRDRTTKALSNSCFFAFVNVDRELAHQPVPPIYPEIAVKARLQGTVVIEATVNERGRVTNVSLLQGAPLLTDAALEAVRKWVYMPTLLNGVPTPIIMTVTVHFRLNGPLA